MPKSCKNVQYDLRRYVSFFKSIPSFLERENKKYRCYKIYDVIKKKKIKNIDEIFNNKKLNKQAKLLNN